MTPSLLAVPNVSTASDATLAELSDACEGAGARVLDVHSDSDHGRSVFTLSAEPLELVESLIALARTALARIDLQDAPGQHPRVGALDVVPVVFLEEEERGPACAAALVVAERLATELSLPVLLYGLLSERGLTRAEIRRGGVSALAARLAAGELLADFGPALAHPTAGAALVAARPVLVAFNLRLAPSATLQDARAVAAAVREGGERGMPGLRAIAVQLGDGAAQVSMNVERPGELPLAQIVAAVRSFAEVTGGEIVGLVPRSALVGMPEDLPLPDFDPSRHVLENALGSS